MGELTFSRMASSIVGSGVEGRDIERIWGWNDAEMERRGERVTEIGRRIGGDGVRSSGREEARKGGRGSNAFGWLRGLRRTAIIPLSRTQVFLLRLLA